jgi:putative ABC transport system permease protein
MIKLAARFARREIRGGLKGFRILVACLALGVAAIAASGSLRAAVDAAIARDARALLGGDLDIRQTHQPFSSEQRAALAAMGSISQGLELRAMALTDGNQRRSLVEVKAVDQAYPLVGQLVLEPPMDKAAALARRDGVWGAAADANLLQRLGIGLGGRLRLGDAWIEIRATIAHEPDRMASALAFGPQLLLDEAAIADTGLIRPGSLVRHMTRVTLHPGLDAATAKQRLADGFPDAAWQIRDSSDAAPGIKRFLDSLADFLALVGLTSLLVGGIGVANAVKAYLDGRVQTIAILKSLGAPAGLILATYLLLVGTLSLAGIVIGLAAGASVPGLVMVVAADHLPLPLAPGPYPMALGVAAVTGGLAALVFTLWPLARARQLPASLLFRRLHNPLAGRPDARSLALLLALGGLLGGVAVAASANHLLAAGFVAASLACMGLFRLLAWGLAAIAKRHGGRAGATWRLALSNLHRPGSNMVGMVMSLGLGLTVMVSIALVEGNLARQFGERMPAQAPSYFFIDIQPDQAARLDAVVVATDPSAQLDQAIMVRGRVSSIAGVPTDQATIAPEAQWAARGDRGLSTARRLPAGTRIVEGAWWPADYAGPPLASIDAQVAKGFGLRVGDRLGLNILGREIEVRVASLRQIDWSSLSMNFAILLSPGVLDGAPHTVIATVHSDTGRDAALEKAVTDALPNVSAIRVKEALETVRGIVAQVDLAVRLAGAVTLAAGILVLAGAILAGHRRRVWDAVVLKVLGASRGQLWRAHLAEFAVIGLATGLVAWGLGSAAAWAVLVKVMKADWEFLPGISAATLAIALVFSLAAGFAGTWRALAVRPAPLLRMEE